MAREVALEAGGSGRLADPVRDRATAEPAEDRGVRSRRLRADALERGRRVSADEELGALARLVGLAAADVSRPVPSGRRSTSAHVSAAASERRSRASRITVMMATSMSPRRRAYAADSARPPGPVRGR